MFISISAGIVTFLLTVVGIPAFIQFYRKAQITGQQMHEDVKQHQAKLARQLWGTCFPHCCSCGEFPCCSFFKTIDQ